MIELKDVFYTYKNNGSEDTNALKGVSLRVEKGDFLGIIGHTGSGKSTLAEIMSGLLKPQSGTVCVEGIDITKAKSPVRELKGKVGIVFQYPEHQLFEETVIKDVAFGAKNMGFSEEESIERAREAMALVGLSEKYEELSPFELSGGEKRRVAIAGILVMRPKVVILDEPTAGLDPVGRDSLLEKLENIKGRLCESVVLISHSMEDVAAHCNRAIVMKKGEKIMDGTVREVFSDADRLLEVGLDIPQITRLIYRLNKKGYDFDKNILTVREAADAIYNRIKGEGKC